MRIRIQNLTLCGALLLSLLLHFLLLALPGLDWRNTRPWPQAMRLRVTLTGVAARGEALLAKKPESVPETARAQTTPDTLPATNATMPALPEKSPAASASAVVAKGGAARTESATPAPPAATTADAAEAGAAEIQEGNVDNYPERGEIQYGVYRGVQGFEVGEAVLKWEIDDDRYRLTLNAHTTGIASAFYFFRSGSASALRFAMESEGRFGAFGLTPEFYRTLKNDQETHRAQFDWEAGLLRIDARAPEPLIPGSQDLLSQFLQFGFGAYSQSVAVGASKGVDIWVAMGRNYRQVHFESADPEPLDLSEHAAPPLPAQQEGMPDFRRFQEADQAAATSGTEGRFDALYLRSTDDNPVEFWLARDYLMLPFQVRIQFGDEGETYELRARALTLGEPAETEPEAHP
ncbi:MAG: DUF3108 domain-containing protein [Zoogloeaceae bacterium]|nr:DUF3108 domain-containing protein [Zoogloeaceae bacterium]